MLYKKEKSCENLFDIKWVKVEEVVREIYVGIRKQLQNVLLISLLIHLRI